MKPRLAQLTALSIFCLSAAFGPSAQAANYTWDTAAGDTAITDGGGTWAAGGGNWFNGTAYDQSWANGNGAIFGGGTAGTAGTVTLGGPITVTNLVFNSPFAGNYTIDTATAVLTLNSPARITNNESVAIRSGTGGSLALGAAATVGVVAGKTLTISSPISGSATVGMTKTGNGTLELDGTNTFGNNLNGLNINAGFLTIGGAGALLGNAGAGCVITNNGALIFNSSANSLVFGACAGTGTWEQKGPGKLTFSGGATFTFSGSVTLSGGILRAAINSASFAARTNNLGAGASQLFLNGGELQCATGNNTTNNTSVNYNRNTIVGGSGVTITSDRGTNAGPQGNAVTYTFGTLSISNQTLTVQAGASGLIGGTAGIAFGDVGFTGAPTFLVNNNVANVTTLLTLGAISNDVNLVTFDGTGNSQVNGIIGGGAGTGGLTKNGNGTLTLAGANTYTGNTTIGAGTLALSGSGSIVSSAITVNGAWDVSALSSYTLNNSQDLAGTGSVVGNVSLAAGASLHPGGAGTAGTLTFGNNLTFDAATTAVFDCSSSAVSGNDKVVMTNASATLNGGGATLTINQIGGVNTLAAADYLLFDLTGASGAVAGDFNSTPAWTPSAPANAASYSIVTVGKQVYLKYTAPAGAPVLTIESSPTGGSLVAAQNVPSGSSVTGYAILRTSGGTFIANTNVTWLLANTTGGVVSSNLVVAGDSKSAIFTGYRIGSGQMQIASPGLTSANSGTLTVVAGVPSQLGIETQPDGSGTAVAAQTLAVGSTVTGYAIRRDSVGNFVDNVSATWSLANKYGGVADADLAGAGASATFTANLGGSATMHAVSGALAGDSGLLTVYQDLRWTGNGTDWDTTTAPNWVVLPAGSVNAAFVNNLSSVLFDDNGAMNSTVNLAASLSPTSVTVAGATSYQFGGTGKITGATSLTNNGSGTLTLQSANDYTGGTVTTAGRIRLGKDNALGTGPVTLSAGALSSDSATARTLTNALMVTANSTFGDLTDTGVLTNAGLVTWSGSGTARVTTFNSDVVFAGGAAALWTAAGNSSKAGPGTLTLRGGVNLSNNVRNVSFDVTQGALVLDGAKLTNYGRVGIIAASGMVARLVITNGATVSQYAIGNERIGLAGATGGTNICDLAGTYSLPDNRAGNLIFNNAGNLQELNLLPGGDTTVYAVTNEATGSGITRFNFNGGTLRTKGNNPYFFQGLSEANVQAGGAKIEATNIVTIAQPLLDGGGAGGLAKTGNGILTLSATNTYTGLTTVSNGALWVEGSLAGAATVCAGASLGGDGTILGAVANQAGATLSPGTNAIGTLAISNTLTLNAGSLTVMELNQTSGASDQVVGLSAVTYGGTLVVTNLGGILTNGSQFTLFSATSSSGSFSSISGSPGANLVWSFNPATGVLSAVNGVSPTNTIAFSISGSTMTLTWPNPGWYAQSNSVNLADTNYWFDIPNSQLATNQMITINPSSAKVFYRLRKP